MVEVVEVGEILVEIGLTGKEFVSWYQGVRQQDHCTDEKLLLSEDVSVHVPTDNEEVLEVGTYTYDFEFMIPEDLPGSYSDKGGEEDNKLVKSSIIRAENSLNIRSKGEGCTISYTVTAFIRMAHPDPEQESFSISKAEEFKLIEKFDTDILISDPHIVKKVEKFFLGGNPVTCKAKIANGGVLFAGQNIFLNLQINNGSNRKVQHVSLLLVEHAICKGISPRGSTQTLHLKNAILQADIPDARIESRESFANDLMMQVPADTPWNVTGTIIERFYELEIVVDMMIKGNITLIAPITLLGWSPQLKGKIPDVVPVVTSTAHKTQSNGKETNGAADLSSSSEDIHLVKGEAPEPQPADLDEDSDVIVDPSSSDLDLSL